MIVDRLILNRWLLHVPCKDIYANSWLEATEGGNDIEEELGGNQAMDRGIMFEKDSCFGSMFAI